MGMLRVVFGDPLPRRGDELAGQEQRGALPFALQKGLVLLQGSYALLRPVLGTRSAVGGPEAIKPLPHRPKPALDQLRLGMPGQSVLRLDCQPDQYATTLRREVDAADFLVVLAVIHIEDLGNPKGLNSHPQCRADGV